MDAIVIKDRNGPISAHKVRDEVMARLTGRQLRKFERATRVFVTHDGRRIVFERADGVQRTEGVGTRRRSEATE